MRYGEHLRPHVVRLKTSNLCGETQSRRSFMLRSVSNKKFHVDPYPILHPVMIQC